MNNLTLACEKCNTAKGIQSIEVFLAKKPDVLERIRAQVKQPLKDAAAVNVTQWALFERLKLTGLPIECASGGVTKFNRTKRELPKTHWIDASNVGKSTPVTLHIDGVKPLLIKAMGHGSRQMCRMDRFGFPRTSAKGSKHVKGFQTGDMVKAVITQGKHIGTYTGRVAVRSTGLFNLTTKEKTMQGISFRFCHKVQGCDGYQYQQGGVLAPHA